MLFFSKVRLVSAAFIAAINCTAGQGSFYSQTSISNNEGGQVITNLIHADWDTHIQDLEHLLESDLERIQNDASSAVEPRHVNSTILAEDLMHIRQDIERLVQSVKDVELELGASKQKIDEEGRHVQERAAEVETEKFIENLHRKKTKVKVDYITGQFVHSKLKPTSQAAGGGKDYHVNATMTKPLNSIRNDDIQTQERPRESVDEASMLYSPTSNNDDDDAFIGEKKDASETVRQHIKSHPDVKSRIKEEMKFLKMESDPAVFKFDTELMLDVVKLAITASLFGLAAVFLKLPPSAGFLLGGMLIGPSCFDLLGEIHQVRTLAQFGAVFLLFEQGLLYSQTYIDESWSSVNNDDISLAMQELTCPSATESSNFSRQDNALHPRKGYSQSVNSPSAETSAPSFLEDDHDPNVVGFILLILLIFVALVVVVLTDVAASAAEAIMVSSTIALCSSTIITETLEAANIAHTQWGVGVLKMINKSIHDLFMVPLLALPELLVSLKESINSNYDDMYDSIPFWSVSKVVLKLMLVVVFLKISTFLATYIIRTASFADSRLISAKGELFTLSVVAYALLIATVSDELNMSLEAGAVLAGVALYRSPYVPKVIECIQPITSIFGGMYMTSLGMIISPKFVLLEAGSILELVCLIGVFKLALVSTVLKRFFDYEISKSLALGSAMAHISEFSLLVLAKSQSLGLIRRKTYLLFIPTTCIMLTLAPLSAGLLRRLPKTQGSGSRKLLLSIFSFLGILQKQTDKHGKTVHTSTDHV